MEEKNQILKEISKEIEEKYNGKVVAIRFAQLLSLCVMYKVVFNDDFLYKPLKGFPNPETICFSEKSMNFTRRVDLFDCMKKVSRWN